jgi:large subunit ribosomal protein L44e
MKISREMRVYCPKCNKHTEHTVRLYSKKPSSGLSVGTRRAERKRTGYIGKVKGQAKVTKLAKRQKILLECKVCKRTIERVVGSRVKKKLEIKT